MKPIDRGHTRPKLNRKELEFVLSTLEVLLSKHRVQRFVADRVHMYEPGECPLARKEP